VPEETVVADRTYSPQEIQDRFAIEDLYDRQLAAAEAHDWERYDTTFTADASIDLSDFDRPAEAYPDYRAWLVAAAPSMLRAQRIRGGLGLSLDGDRATTRVAYTCHIQVAGPDGPMWIHNGNFYNDVLVRTADGWRVAQRYEELSWMEAPAGRPSIDAPPTTTGAAP
jgi:hypothetical protein